jgi:hypothetical protein
MADIDEIIQQNEQRISEDEVIQLAALQEQTSFAMQQRAPRLRDQEMNDLQMRATDSERPAGYLGVNYNQYFDVGFTKALSTDIEGMIEKFLASVPTHWTVSVGGDFPFKLRSEYTGSPGLTPMFYLAQDDISSHGISSSQTFGGGGLAGVFATRTTSSDSTNVTWSAGAYFDLSKTTALMVSVNVTDFVKGDVVFDVGVFQGLPGGRNIEVSREFRPSDALYDMFYNVFGGLADYRNYQSF